jgi:hypothetical protein
MSDKRFRQSGVVRERPPSKRRQFVPARELAEALADVPAIDYERLRADIDAVVDQDPTPRHWVD